MAKYRIEKKQSQKIVSLQVIDTMKKQEALIVQLYELVQKQEKEKQELVTLLQQQCDYLDRFNAEYQDIKTQNAEKCIRTYIEMRDSMIRDMKFFASKGWQDTPGYEYLDMYVRQYTELLADMDVEIIECKKGERLDRSIAKACEVVAVKHPEWHELIADVRTDGYRWKGRVLQKSKVIVAVYK